LTKRSAFGVKGERKGSTNIAAAMGNGEAVVWMGGAKKNTLFGEKKGGGREARIC